MRALSTGINGLFVLEPIIYGDSRGWFMESYNKFDFTALGIHYDFIQDNHSFSQKQGVLRGLHIQIQPFSQAKLVRCIRGRIWDVAVDLRRESPTFKKWFGLELSEQNKLMFLIPQDFAHGFITLEENSEVQYKVDRPYNKLSERSIKYDDPSFGIIWPIIVQEISAKDSTAPNFDEKKWGLE